MSKIPDWLRVSPNSLKQSSLTNLDLKFIIKFSWICLVVRGLMEQIVLGILGVLFRCFFSNLHYLCIYYFCIFLWCFWSENLVLLNTGVEPPSRSGSCVVWIWFCFHFPFCVVFVFHGGFGIWIVNPDYLLDLYFVVQFVQR